MRRNLRKRTMPEGLAPAAKGEPPLRTRGEPRRGKGRRGRPVGPGVR